MADLKAKSSSKRSSSSKSGGSHRSKGTMFTSYFRKQQKKEAEKKEERLRESSEKLREVLAPVQFSQAEEERLRELKQYKRWKRIQQEQEQRHREIKSKTMPSIPETTTRAVDLEEGRMLGRRGLPDNSCHRDQQQQQQQQPPDKFVQRTMKALHQHTWEQRISVIATLVVLLFISLHADVLGPRILPRKFFLDNRLVPWYIIVLKDWGTFCYMSTCALIHFALCDISLIYAFEAMEVGTKTGPKVKEFYRTKVHLAVAALSGSIVAFSICKALLGAWFRMLRELLETAFGLLSHGKGACASVFQSVISVPHNIVNGVAKIGNFILTARPSEWFSSLCAGFARLFTGLCIWILAVVIPFDAEERPSVVRMMNGSVKEDLGQHFSSGENNMTEGLLQNGSNVDDSHNISHTLGQNMTALFNATLNVTLNATLGGLVDDDGDIHAFAPLKVKEMMSWRTDAFDTCRALLSHSAVFLVSLLVGMHFYTKGYRHKTVAIFGPHNTTRRGNDTGIFMSSGDDHSSIRTTPSLARDETELHANLSSDTSFETSSTIAARPTSITVTIAPE